jgi:hypothetical protein
MSALPSMPDIRQRIHVGIRLAVYESTPYRVFSKISRPINMRLISLVPAPIS